MARYDLIIAGITLNPTVPPEAVTRSGGGRSITEKVTITGRVLRVQGARLGCRVRVTSPGPEWVLSEAQITGLRALEGSQTPFSVTLGPGYELSGTFNGCLFEGDAVFSPKRGGGWTGYDFTLYIP